MDAAKTPEAIAEKKSEPKKYGALTVEKRALIMSDVTINTSNIARLQTSKSSKESEMGWSGIALGTVLSSAVLCVVGAAIFQSNIPPQLFILIFIGAVLIARSLPKVEVSPGVEIHYLTVHTNDGGRFLFWAPAKDTIDTVRRIITDKINNTDEPTVYNVNFETGVIENMGVGSIGNVGSIGAIVSGTGNQVTGVAGNGRVNTQETVHNTVIDYSQSLPVLMQWREHFQRQGNQEIGQKLADLEALLRSGTPSPVEKNKLGSLLRHLADIFKTSTQALAFFDQIRRLAGI